jgi:ribonuclease P protein component
VTSRYLIVLSLPSPRSVDRLGIIASRRLGGAVLRNRTKRRLREIFRQSEARVRGADRGGALDLVVIPRREVAVLPFDALATEFRRVLDRSRAVSAS